MADGPRNIFISHIHEDDERLEPLKELLGQCGFEVRDSSINKDKPNDASDPDYIKSTYLGPHIDWASVLVVLISPETKQSDWVKWEIEYAAEQGKRIIGVWDHGAADCDVPEALDWYADAVVGWQGDRVKAAITGAINNWESADGTPGDMRPLPRYSCR